MGGSQTAHNLWYGKIRVDVHQQSTDPQPGRTAVARSPKNPPAIKGAAASEPDIAPVLHSNLPLIEVAESWLLDAIMSDAAAARTIAVRLSDRVAIVTPGQIDALFTRLRKLGHVPRMLEE